MVGGHEDQARAVGARQRQQEVHGLAEKLVRHLDEDAGTVPGIRVGTSRAAMFEIDEEVEGLADYRVRTNAFDVRDKADAAGVVLVGGAIQASLVTGIHGALSKRIPIREKSNP